MASWAPDDGKPGVSIPMSALLVSVLVGAVLWLLLALAIYAAFRFAIWNGGAR